MEDISKIYEINVLLNEHKTLFELKNEFYSKYNEILLIKDDPSSESYHRLYDELWDLHSKIRCLDLEVE
ncbi:hypothetical protein [Methanobacterium spitsbergense]|uniref:Uncharacterized protein n=1 Tax=Methanobacterium spitsbergense TaxID=2874285 RepID=A0A8T5URB5_9EURY|nr:hypothetical protein [Methanobacterium spitsbergense]MBZ2164687.1 hypothetical protein [Methanobacterium spitsbergense]